MQINAKRYCQMASSYFLHFHKKKNKKKILGTNADLAARHMSLSSVFSKDQTCREMQEHDWTVETLKAFKEYL